jgi:hypothetical protein
VAILALGVFFLIKVEEVKSGPENVVNFPVDESDSDDPGSWETLLKTGTNEEMLDALVSSEGRISDNNPVIIYVEMSQRAAIAKRLLQTDIGESQERYVTLAYLQSLTKAELTNIAARLNFDGSRERTLQAGRQYENARHPEIAAAASLVPVLVHLYDYMAERDPRYLDLIRTQFDQGQEKILCDRTAAAIFAAVVFRLNEDPDYPNETTALLWHILNQFESQVTPETADLLTAFRDILNFGDIEIEKLPQHVLDENPYADEQARRLFDVLARNPTAGIKVYRQAIAVIGAYKQTGQDQLANILEKRLGDTALRIEDAEKREMLLAEIENPLLISEVENTAEPDLQFGLPDLSELQPER